MPTGQRILRAALHAAGATVFFYVFQRYALDQDVRSSLLFGLALGVAAALVSWTQTGRAGPPPNG